jgi:hypothetical protein
MADIPLIGKREATIGGPIVRLLRCMVCETWEELPDYEGPSNMDILLEIAIEKHKFPSGEPHVGKLFKVPEKTWSDPAQRRAVLDQLAGKGAAGLDALDPDSNFYETKSQFAEDALTCYERHNRPQVGCEDYQIPSKRLLPNTAKERADLGIESPENAPGPKVYLCNFCPFHSVAVTTNRMKQGMYDV